MRKEKKKCNNETSLSGFQPRRGGESSVRIAKVRAPPLSRERKFRREFRRSDHKKKKEPKGNMRRPKRTRSNGIEIGKVVECRYEDLPTPPKKTPGLRRKGGG